MADQKPNMGDYYKSVSNKGKACKTLSQAYENGAHMRLVQGSIADAGYAGENCIPYNASSADEKTAFETGLGKWLAGNHIEGVNASDISHPDALRGFIYKLISTGLIESKDPDYYPPSPRSADELIRATLLGYEADILANILENCREECSAAEKKEIFENGLSIAENYMDKREYKEFCERVAQRNYGIDTAKLPEEEKKRLFRMHSQIADDYRTKDMPSEDLESVVIQEFISNSMQQLNELFYSGQISQNHVQQESGNLTELFYLCKDFETGMALYSAKVHDIDEMLAEGNLDGAENACDYIDLLLKTYSRSESEIRSNLDKRRSQAMNSEGYSLEEETPLEQFLSELNLTSKIYEAERLREEVEARKTDPVYALQERLKACVQREEYEEAAKVRDQLAKLQQ